MALINCPECGLLISDKAHVCVHCGCPTEVKNVDGIEYIVRRVVDDDARLEYIKITATLYMGDWLTIIDALQDYSENLKDSSKMFEKDEELKKIFLNNLQDTNRLRATLEKMFDK